MSYSVPSLPRGIAESILFLTSSLHEDPGGSKIAPGATAFTLISGASSLAKTFVAAKRPPFAAV